MDYTQPAMTHLNIEHLQNNIDQIASVEYEVLGDVDNFYVDEVFANKVYIQFIIGFHSNVNTQLGFFEHSLLIQNTLFSYSISVGYPKTPQIIFCPQIFPESVSISSCSPLWSF